MFELSTGRLGILFNLARGLSLDEELGRQSSEQSRMSTQHVATMLTTMQDIYEVRSILNLTSHALTTWVGTGFARACLVYSALLSARTAALLTSDPS